MVVVIVVGCVVVLIVKMGDFGCVIPCFSGHCFVLKWANSFVFENLVMSFVVLESL